MDKETTPEVDQMESMYITGDIIPHRWYKELTKETGKPYLDAIVILSNIVYWYRPSDIVDERTGFVVGKKKKFSSDILQRSYKQLSEQFGLSERQARNAIVFLEEKGLIKRELRNLRDAKDNPINNVLFIRLFPSEVAKISIFNKQNPRKSVSPKSEGYPVEIGDTNTKNTTETIGTPFGRSHDSILTDTVHVKSMNERLAPSQPKNLPSENHQELPQSRESMEGENNSFSAPDFVDEAYEKIDKAYTANQAHRNEVYRNKEKEHLRTLLNSMDNPRKWVDETVRVLTSKEGKRFINEENSKAYVRTLGNLIESGELSKLVRANESRWC